MPMAFPPNFRKPCSTKPRRRKPIDPQGRTDLRAIPLVTIDPEDARDHDDAVWAGPDDDAANQGGHVVIVAIADVAHYVTPGSALDKEALKRGNCAYFPDRVVPMLPEELSADLCSLKEGEDRPCLAVRMVFDATATSAAHQFLRAHDAFGGAADLCPGAGAPSTAIPMPACSAMVQKTLADLWTAYQIAHHRARKARVRSISICRNGASCWARTARSPPSPFASGWNP